MKFINTALSQQRLPYTITTVYKFVEKTRRRRRSVMGPMRERGQIAVNTDLVPYDSAPARKRRDLLEAASYPQGKPKYKSFQVYSLPYPLPASRKISFPGGFFIKIHTTCSKVSLVLRQPFAKIGKNQKYVKLIWGNKKCWSKKQKLSHWPLLTHKITHKCWVHRDPPPGHLSVILSWPLQFIWIWRSLDLHLYQHYHSNS